MEHFLQISLFSALARVAQSITHSVKLSNGSKLQSRFLSSFHLKHQESAPWLKSVPQCFPDRGMEAPFPLQLNSRLPGKSRLSRWFHVFPCCFEKQGCNSAVRAPSGTSTTTPGAFRTSDCPMRLTSQSSRPAASLIASAPFVSLEWEFAIRYPSCIPPHDATRKIRQ